MKTKIIQIGNSKGLRIPQAILKQYKISDAVELIFEENQIVLKPIFKPRKDWEASFQEMAKRSDDELLIDDIFDEEDFEEWI